MNRRALVIGGGLAGVRAAHELADAGAEVSLIEEADCLAPEQPGNLALTPELLGAYSHRNIKVITGAHAVQVSGEKGRFRVAIVRKPRYIDIEKCVACGRCERACPVDIRQESGKGKKAIHSPGIKTVPSAYAVTKEGLPPCTATCPAGVNTNGYIALISQGKIAQALDLITEAVPFPRVLGRVCSHPCERKCTRGKVDYPVSICALKRFAADAGSAGSSLNRTQNANGVKLSGKPRVAIIGAGPAGLTAARDLARMGHKSTVFEALPVPGGMITVGMPRFRLPREVRQADIDDIVRLGIEIRTSTPIGDKLTLDDLRRQGYEAILIATGAHKNQRLGLAGETLAGVIDSIALLQALNLKQPITVGSKVVVIGGGYTAIDSARTAIRLQCERVLILYRRSLEEMPANAEEVALAREEGVEIQYLVSPVRIIGKEGKVAGVECIRMGLGEPDSSGRRRPIPIAGSEFCVEADTVIVAVGQRPDLSFLTGELALPDGRKHITTDRVSMATRVPGIFAAGDVCGETGTLIDAIAAGRRAAVSIDRYLRNEPIEERHQARELPAAVDLERIYIPPIERQHMPCLPVGERKGNFEEVELGFDAGTATEEARRCLNCAGCSVCLECERACELGAIDHKAAPERLELEFDAVITAGQESVPGIHSLDAYANLTAALATAGRVMAELGKREPRELLSSPAPRPRETGSARVGLFVCGCGGNIAEVIDINWLIERSRGIPGMCYVAFIDYACTDETAEKIRAAAGEHGLTHAVLAACSCCNLDQICYSCTDRRVRCKKNLLGEATRYDFVNIREQCAWAHRSRPDEATAKALSLIVSAAARLVKERFSPERKSEIIRRALIVGGGEAGRRAAADLQAQGFETISTGGESLIGLERAPGGYTASISRDGRTSSLKAGAVILDIAEHEMIPLLASMKCRGGAALPGLFACAGADGAEWAAAAARTAAFLGKGTVEIKRNVAVVEAGRCRACGTCARACLVGAIAVRESALVDEALCQGCGTCVARCPSGALSQGGYSDSEISASLEALLKI